MTHNISRLVNLMDQQTQFFSTLQARGFFERAAPTNGPSRAGAPPPPPPPPPPPSSHTAAEDVPMDVDEPAFVPIPRRPRRGRAQEIKPKGLPTQRDAQDVLLAVRASAR